MNIGFKEIQLKNGSVLPVADGITIVVGPNNAGKTRLLWDIAHFDHRSQPEPDTGLIARTVPRYRDTADDAIEWLIQNARTIEDGQSRVFSFDFNLNLRESFVRSVWGSEDRWPIVILPLVRLLGVDSRLDNIRDTESFNVLDGQGFQNTRSLSDTQKLWANPKLLAELNELLQQAFGLEISIPRDLGPKIAVFVGSPSGSIESDPDAYRLELQRTPRLSSQGHGVRAYASILMSIVATSARVLIIDEPEAFLHPPQARLLGQVLERVRSSGTQIILATHSPDIVQGIVSTSGTRSEVSIARVSQIGGDIVVSSIPSNVVSEMALSPLLRHSSILDGLFYRGTIVCESGGDCLYYGAVLDSLIANSSLTRESQEVHFTHCSGSNRIPEAVSALLAANIPTASIVDMDVLEDSTILNRIIQAHGGLAEGSSIESDLKTVRNQVRAGIRPVLRRDAEARIHETLSSGDAEHLTPQEVSAIRKHVRSSGGWQEVKEKGLGAFIGSSAAYRAAQRIVGNLAMIGIFIVPVGELESFHPELDRRDKNRWLVEAIEQEQYAVAGEHLTFIDSIVRYLTQSAVSTPG